MVEQVRRFGCGFLLGAGKCGNYHFAGLLGDLLGYPRLALVEQARGVRTLGAVALSLLDDVHQFRKDTRPGRLLNIFERVRAVQGLLKQESLPVWHAGPVGSTFTRTASASQSAKISLTLR